MNEDNAKMDLENLSNGGADLGDHHLRQIYPQWRYFLQLGSRGFVVLEKLAQNKRVFYFSALLPLVFLVLAPTSLAILAFSSLRTSRLKDGRTVRFCRVNLV